MRYLKVSVFLVLALCIVSIPAFAGSLNFPKAGQYTIHSQPAFLITVGDNKEVVECQATLVLQAGDPYFTKSGARRVDLKIVDWKAEGVSKLMGGPLNFRMNQKAKTEDESFVETYTVAQVKGEYKDFPAKAQFAVPYEIDTPFGTVSGLYGVTRGSIRSFPPKGDTFLMEKGDVAKVMATLLPSQLSSVSAAGEVQPAEVSIQPLACLDPTAGAEE